MNIVELFLKASERFPEKAAIIEKDLRISYHDLKDAVSRTAGYFRDQGIGKGDRVLVFVPMGIDLYRILMAIFYIGATAVFLDEWVNFKRLNLCCRLADCKGFIGVRKTWVLKILSHEVRKIPIKLSISRRSSHSELCQMEKDDAALISFTTGSTGTPKAALRSHSFLLEQFRALELEIAPKSEDIDMSTLPIVLFINLGIGSTSVIADFKMSKPEKMNPGRIIDQINENGVNRIIASPFFIRKLAEFQLEQSQLNQKPEKIFTGGAPVFPDEAKLFTEAFQDTDIRLVYGSTEAEPIASVAAHDLRPQNILDDGGLLVGTVFEKTLVKIIPISSSDMVRLSEKELEDLGRGEGEIGEIIVAGPHVLKTYYNNDDAFRRNKIVTEKQIWHRTGDGGFIRNKQLYLVGRCDELIRVNDSYLSLLVAEHQIRNTDGVKVGTLIQIEDKLVLAYESDIDVNFPSSLPYDQVVRIKIPKDPRHFSKIDYSKLRRVLQKRKY